MLFDGYLYKNRQNSNLQFYTFTNLEAYYGYDQAAHFNVTSVIWQKLKRVWGRAKIEGGAAQAFWFLEKIDFKTN